LVIGSPYDLGFMVAIWFYVGISMVLDKLSMVKFSNFRKISRTSTSKSSSIMGSDKVIPKAVFQDFFSI
jgi:hypothetical protein